MIGNASSGFDKFKLTLLAVYAVAIGTGLFLHTMWLDEFQAWLIARDSPDIPSLFHNMRYEGHPPLWHLLLWPLARVSRNPALMQGLHFVIAMTTITLVLWRAPLSRLEQALFPFGYFVVYEYAIKSRSYALGFLLLVAVCVLWRQRWQRPILLALLLAPLANVHILFTILSMAVVLALIVDRFTAASDDAEPHAPPKQVITALAIVVTAWIVAIAIVIPPPDTGFAVGWFFRPSLYKAARVLGILGALFRPAVSIWFGFAALAILGFAAVRLRSNLTAAAFLFVSVTGLLAFFYTKYDGDTWHWGMIFIAFFASLWIARISTPKHRPALIPAPFVAAVLLVQVFSGVYALVQNIRQPLSSGKAVARALSSGVCGDPTLIGFRDLWLVSILGYLDKDRAYYANGRRWGSFMLWDQKRLEDIDVESFLKSTAGLTTNVALVASDDVRFDPSLPERYGFYRVGHFGGASFVQENYTLFCRRPG